MKHIKILHIIFLSCFLFGIIATVSSQQIIISNKYDFLKDINKLGVIVEGLPFDADNKLGLTKERLITITELKLRREGIEILDKDFALFLYININIVGGAFHIELKLIESVYIPRLKATGFGVATWSTGTTGTHAYNSEYIVSSLSKLLDEFLNDYYKVNPKK